MISSSEAKYLIGLWAGLELAEIRREVYYPAASPMFKDHQAGYRSSDLPVSREEKAEKVGAVIRQLRPYNQSILRRVFIERLKVGRITLGIALDEFRRVWSAELDAHCDQPSCTG